MAKYTDDELRSVTPEELAQVNMTTTNLGQVFTQKDPNNPYYQSQITPNTVRINEGVLGLRSQGRAMAGSSLDNFRASRSGITGNQNQFIEQRISPLRGQINNQQQALTTRLNKTGVTGEFARQTQQNFTVSGQQKLAQGKQLALDEFTALSNNLDNVEGGMLRLVENIDFDAITKDFQARGMQQNLLNQIRQIDQGRIGQENADSAANRQEVGNWISLLAQLFS